MNKDEQRYPQLVCLLTGGPTHQLRVGSDLISFEWHPYCGPMPIWPNGNERRLRHNHPFWRAVSEWARNNKGEQT